MCSPHTAHHTQRHLRCNYMRHCYVDAFVCLPFNHASMEAATWRTELGMISFPFRAHANTCIFSFHLLLSLFKQFNGTTHGMQGNGMMELYDVAFTSYHAQDSRALLEMHGIADISSQHSHLDRLRRRVQATELELHRCVDNHQ